MPAGSPRYQSAARPMAWWDDRGAPAQQDVRGVGSRGAAGPAGPAGSDGQRRDPPGRPGPAGYLTVDPAPEHGPPGDKVLTLGLGRGSRERELVRRVTVPVTGSRRVVVLSIKGGVGKTTTVAVAGSLLAGLRRDRVVALDASSDWGTLAARLSVVPRQTVRELAAHGRHAISEHGIRAQLVVSPSGLYVVGSDPQSMVSGALTGEEYRQAVFLLEYVANVLIVDLGAGMQQPFLPIAIQTCDQLVVATAATWDAAQSAGAALDWLAARGRADLVERAVVVMNNLHPTRRKRRGFVEDLRTDLERRVRAVHDVPFDPALQPGGRILLRKLAGPTRLAYLEVAADLIGGLVTVPR
jgi:MinD-like ATPase involved in chromosome partitioning or flagellar assembly